MIKMLTRMIKKMKIKKDNQNYKRIIKDILFINGFNINAVPHLFFFVYYFKWNK